MKAIHRSRLVRTVMVGVVALGVVLAVPGAAEAKDKRELTVMSRNIYLGSSLNPALAAQTPAEFVGAVAQIYGTMLFTDFPARAQALADEIDAANADLIGLQEVSRWTVTKVGNQGATAPSFDFLSILQQALASRGLHYEVAAVSNNANIGPVPLVTVPSLGCNNPLPPVPDCLVSLQDRDVILVNTDTPGLAWSNARNGLFNAQAVLTTPVGELSFDRGWTSIDATYYGKKVRFVNSHFETEDAPAIQEAQAAEFLAGPARPTGAVIAVGDFNSAADGSTTTSYAQLTGFYTDAWVVSGVGPGLTCCQNSTLTNYPPNLGSRIDLVLFRGPVRGGSATVVGADPFQFAPPLYASDHAGVTATVRLH